MIRSGGVFVVDEALTSLPIVLKLEPATVRLMDVGDSKWWLIESHQSADCPGAVKPATSADCPEAEARHGQTGDCGFRSSCSKWVLDRNLIHKSADCPEAVMPATVRLEVIV
ncbi:hypothetical protein N7455_009743 [Penicillium solitum]|uniref:uncharacterized protein n=1 Tax=Penicillium solitum TaxID=60172 RepID=UPI0032C43065|nr:hypothetical protein N7455_009743 [Penicillium solitum]